MEYCDKAGEIQQISHPNEYLKGLFNILYGCLTESSEKLGTFLLNKLCLEMNEIDNVINKIVLLIQYPNKKTNFRRIKLNSDLVRQIFTK